MSPTNITTNTLSNPGIIDRLEQDIADYLSPFGFRLERQQLRNDGVVAKGSSSSNHRAVLVIPPLPYSYSTTNNNGTTKNTAMDDAISDGSNAISTVVTSTVILEKTPIPDAGPIGTLHLHVHRESLLSTVGPLLRTFLRLSPHQISPMRLRSVIHCHFTLDALEKIDKMNSEQKRNQLSRQEELSARRMAHHVHMLVRNSMGSALCLELVVILPYYWSRKMQKVNDAMQSTGSKVPISLESVLSATRDNPDACYPSVQLVEQKEDGMHDVDNACNNITCSSTAIHLDVRTRMCTVRHQPLLFRWVSSLQCPTENGYGSVPRNERLDSIDGQQLLEAYPEPFEAMPLIVACIEKVSNMHRILMLCHDYDKIHCTNNNGNSVQNNDERSSKSSLLSDVIVILPNANGDDRGQSRDGKGKRGELANDDRTIREFEDAVDNFHKVIIDSESGNNNQRYSPTFVYEEHAAEKISTLIERRQSCSARPTLPTRPSIVGIDIHPDALTLHGNYLTSNPPTLNQSVSPALQKVRDADAIVFGYESTGIPENVADELSGWVQIPSRSSINVVAAMSIVLDALLGAGLGVDDKLINHHH